MYSNLIFLGLEIPGIFNSIQNLIEIVFDITLVIFTVVSFVIFIKLKGKAVSINTYLRIRTVNFSYQHIKEGNMVAGSSLLEKLRYYG